jgi:hypothetical protein
VIIVLRPNCTTYSGLDGSLLMLQLVSISDGVVTVSVRGQTDDCAPLRAKFATYSCPDGSLLVLQYVSVDNSVTLIVRGTN